MVDCIGASWGLENAKSPATMPQENNPDATRMIIVPYVPGIIPYVVCTWYLAEVLAMYQVLKR